MAKKKERGVSSGWAVCDAERGQFMDRTYNMTRNVAEAFLYPNKAAAQAASDVKGGVGGKMSPVRVTIRAELEPVSPGDTEENDDGENVAENPEQPSIPGTEPDTKGPGE